MTGQLPISAEAAARLTLDTEPWLSCDDCFEQVDGHVERLVSGQTGLPADFRTHLLGCQACFEEARSLVALVAQEDGADPGSSLSRLDRAVHLPSAGGSPEGSA